jgi:hypothetical protein
MQIVRETLPRKYTSQKSAGGVAQGVGPEFKPQYHRKKKAIIYSTLQKLLGLAVK